jgi:hypothetical protein
MRGLQVTPMSRLSGRDSLHRLRKTIQARLAYFGTDVGTVEIFFDFNKKKDGMLDVYEFAFGLSKLGIDSEIIDLIQAFDLLSTQSPYYMTIEEFHQRVVATDAIENEKRLYDHEDSEPEVDVDQTKALRELLTHVALHVNNRHYKLLSILKDKDLHQTGHVPKGVLTSVLYTFGLRLDPAEEDTVVRILANGQMGPDLAIDYSLVFQLLSFVSFTNHRDSECGRQIPSVMVRAAAKRSHMRQLRVNLANHLQNDEVLLPHEYKLVQTIANVVYSRRTRLLTIFRRLDKERTGTLTIRKALASFTSMGLQLRVSQMYKLAHFFTNVHAKYSGFENKQVEAQLLFPYQPFLEFLDESCQIRLASFRSKAATRSIEA